MCKASGQTAALLPRRPRGLNKRRRVLVPAAALTVAMVFAAGMAFPRGKPSIQAFLPDPCGGCTTAEIGCRTCDAVDALALDILEECERQEIADKVSFVVENTRIGVVKTKLDALAGKLGLNPAAIRYPLVTVDGALSFEGPFAVRDAVEAAGGKLSRGLFSRATAAPEVAPADMVYYYSELCGDCQRAEQLLADALPALEASGVALWRLSVERPDGQASFAAYRRGHAGEPGTVPLLVWRGKSYRGSGEIGGLLQELAGASPS